MAKVSSNEDKIMSIADLLQREIEDWRPNVPSNKRLKWKRYGLKLLIMRALNIVDPHTINSWVNRTLTCKYPLIEQNPHTHKTKGGYIKPSNDTLYILNEKNIKHYSDMHSLREIEEMNR